MTRCTHCCGTMQQMGYDDGTTEIRCMLCGRDNRPPVTIDELLIRRRSLNLGVPRNQRKNWNRTRSEKDADYQKLLDAIEHRTEPFTTRDIADIMGKPSMLVAGWIRRASDDLYIRKVGRKLVRNTDGGAIHPTKIALWQTVSMGKHEATG